MLPESFRCLLVEQNGEALARRVATLPAERLPRGEVTVRVAYSSLNYKDALAWNGQRGIVRSFPHVPGIDAAGQVLASDSPLFGEGDEVLVTGYDLGQAHWGGWSELICVPADWLVRLPRGLTPRSAMILGTAGFTAAQCVHALRQNGIAPDSGQLIVTGATGGVGSLAVSLLAKLGYSVVAVSGKSEQRAALGRIGARRVMGREELLDDSGRPMLSASWAGGIDTVGGKLLTSLLRQTQYGGCVAACGLVAGAELEMTLYPFLLRGIRLCGVASADCPPARRLEIWDLLAGDWKLQVPEELVTEVGLAQLDQQVARMLQGKTVGRVLVKPG